MGFFQEGIQIFIDALEDQIAILDQDGVILFTNRSWDSFCLENDGDLSQVSTGINYLDGLKGSGLEVERNGIVNVLNGKIEEFTIAYPCHSLTEERWYSMSARRCLVNEEQQGLLIAHRNITKEYLSESLVMDVLESMSDAFLSLDKNWYVTHLNRAAAKLLQRENESLLGTNIWLQFPEAIGSDFYHNYMKTVNEKIVTSFESYFAPLNAWFEVHSYPKRDGGISIYFKNINERKEVEQQLQRFAFYDDLTSLPNRRLMNEKVKAAIDHNEEGAVIHLDIDGFKNINDQYGHEKGDILLERVGQKLQQVLLEDGVVGRLGGDEFLIFIKMKTKNELKNRIQNLLTIFSKPFILDSHYSFSISVSMGVSCFPEDSTDLNHLLSAADTAMYHAKKMRGNHCQYYHSKMTDDLSRRIQIEQDFSGSLRDKGIYFVFQPQIDGRTNELVGFEVLSRWSHPTLGNISPLEFIEIAEESGNILKLTYYLMAEVFSKVSTWIKNHHFSKKISMNVTPYLLSQKSFFLDFFDLLDRFEIPYHQIELEITEETKLEASPDTLVNMKDCRERGVHIAIDDFGTAYSMLTSLTHFPIDKIKIDKYFIQRIGDPQTEAILKSIIYLSQTLNCEIVAEGVEKIEEVQFLLEQGCALFQGYYFEYPLDIDAFEQKYIVK